MAGSGFYKVLQKTQSEGESFLAVERKEAAGKEPPRIPPFFREASSFLDPFSRK